MACTGCGGNSSNGNCKDCNKVTGKALPSNNPCDPNYTGDLIFDGLEFVCANGPGFTIPTGTNFNTTLASIFTQLCNIYDILDNTGTVASSEVTWDGGLFECAADAGFTFDSGDTLNVVILEIATELCEAITDILALEADIAALATVYQESHADEDLPVVAATTEVIETISVVETGTYIVHFSVSLIADNTASWQAFLRNNTTATSYLSGNDVIGSNNGGAAELQNGANFAVIVCTALDDIQVRVSATTANVTVNKVSMYMQKIA